MANSKRNRRQEHSAGNKPESDGTPAPDRQPKANRKIEPARKAPLTERGLTHSPYFNGMLYQRMSEDLHLGGMSGVGWRCSAAPDSAVSWPQQSADDDDLSAPDAHGGDRCAACDQRTLSSSATQPAGRKRRRGAGEVGRIAVASCHPSPTVCGSMARRFFSSTLTRSLCNSGRC